MQWSTMFDGIVDTLSKITNKRHLVERRGNYRIPCRRGVNVLLATKATTGHMLNLSRRGMKVRTHDRLPPRRELRALVSGKKGANDRFSVSIDLICQVVWCRFSRFHGAYDSGLAYVPAQGVDLDYVDAFFRHELGVYDLETFQKRMSRRIDTEMDVTCFTQDGRVTLGAMRDVSLTGARFEGALKLNLEEELRLRIDVGKRHQSLYCVGRVARCSPGLRGGWYDIGISFTEIDKPHMLRRVIEREARPS